MASFKLYSPPGREKTKESTKGRREWKDPIVSLIRSGKFITKNNWYRHARVCKTCSPLAGAGGSSSLEFHQLAAAQAGPSVPGTFTGQENRGEHTRALRPRHAAVRKKRNALEFDEESGNDIEKERKSKVYTPLLCICSPILMCDVFTESEARRHTFKIWP